MYKFKKIIVCIDGKRGDVTNILGGQLFTSMEDAQQWLQSKGFTHYLFTLKEVEE